MAKGRGFLFGDREGERELGFAIVASTCRNYALFAMNDPAADPLASLPLTDIPVPLPPIRDGEKVDADSIDNAEEASRAPRGATSRAGASRCSSRAAK